MKRLKQKWNFLGNQVAKLRIFFLTFYNKFAVESIANKLRTLFGKHFFLHHLLKKVLRSEYEAVHNLDVKRTCSTTANLSDRHHRPKITVVELFPKSFELAEKNHFLLKIASRRNLLSRVIADIKSR